MSKEQYKKYLRKMGYRIEGDTTYLETPYGVWIEEIEEVAGGFGLRTVKNPFEESCRH